MYRLSFRKQYVPLILAGTKTSTLRQREPRYGPGDVIAAVNQWGKPPFAQLRITAVEPVRVEDLTDQQALADGFDSADQLRDQLAKTYAEATDLFRIVFERV